MKRERDKTRVFIVDDERDLLRAVGQSVESLGAHVQLFGAAHECLAALETQHCDLLISDVRMPDMDGLQLLHAARQLLPHLPVLMMSGYADIPTAVRAVKEGAFNFLEKPLDESTLLPMVRQIMERVHPEQGKGAQALTDSERAVLRLVAAGKTNKEIAYELGRSIRTVENHRFRLMRKLGVDSTAALVKLAVEIGVG